ncbi:lipase family protein [Gordonia sp. NPDC003424]
MRVPKSSAVFLPLMLVVAVVVGLLAGPADAAPTTTTRGAVLTQTPLSASSLPSGAGSGYRLLYVTRDQNNRPVTSTGALYLPRGPVPTGGWPVVSWAHGTSGISDKCSPSAVPGAIRDRLEPPISTALRAGYAVTASDYPGLGSGGTAEYLGGRAAARAVIDMIRASRDVDPAVSRRWVSTGHSQGGHAALWAAHEAPSYAPDLHLVGAVPFAPASQVEHVIPAVSPGIPDVGRYNGLSGLVLYILSGLDHARPDLHVRDYLSPSGRSWLGRATQYCVDEFGKALAGVPPGSLLAKPLADPAFTAALTDYLAVPPGGYHTPIRIEQGGSDQLTTVATSVLVGQMLAAGTAVSVRLYPGVDHQGVVTVGQQDAFATIAHYFGR